MHTVYSKYRYIQDGLNWVSNAPLGRPVILERPVSMARGLAARSCCPLQLHIWREDHQDLLSTHLYCPTSSMANIVYFDTRELAATAGFRPCTKCKPDDIAFMGQREEIVFRTLNLIWANEGTIAKSTGLRNLARDVDVTPSYLCRVFKKTMGCTLGEYIRRFEGGIGGEGSTVSPSTMELPAILADDVPESLPWTGGLPSETRDDSAYDTRALEDHIQSGAGHTEVDFDAWLWPIASNDHLSQSADCSDNFSVH